MLSTLSFARSWDRFTRAAGPRPASQREVRILVTQLEASLVSAGPLEFDGAIAEHRQLRGRRMRRARVVPATAEPSGEIAARRLRPIGRRGRAHLAPA